VLWHFTMSLDGLVAGTNHEMGWMTGISFRPGMIDEYVETTGAVVAGRDGWDAATSDSRPYGGSWGGPIFVLTHHPEDATPTDGITFLDCGPAEAVRIGLEAASGKNLEVFSPTIGRQLLELGLIDEIDLHIAPILQSCSARASGCTTTPAAIRSASPGSAKATPLRPLTCGTEPPQPQRSRLSRLAVAFHAEP